MVQAPSSAAIERWAALAGRFDQRHEGWCGRLFRGQVENVRINLAARLLPSPLRVGHHHATVAGTSITDSS